MKNTNKRLIAGLLSVVTLLSVAATSVATVSAAEQTRAGVTDQTIGAVLHESSNRKLNTAVQPSEAVSKVIEYILEATGTKGGAIFFGINNSTNHSLHTVTLTNNEAGNRGGAIYSDSSWQSTGSVNLHGVIILKDNHKTNGQKDNFYGDSTNCGLWTNKAKLEKCGDFDSRNSILE